MGNDWAIPVLAVGLATSTIVIAILLLERFGQQTYQFPPTAVRQTEYVRDAQGRIIARYEEVGFMASPTPGSQIMVRAPAGD